MYLGLYFYERRVKLVECPSNFFVTAIWQSFCRINVECRATNKWHGKRALLLIKGRAFISIGLK